MENSVAKCKAEVKAVDMFVALMAPGKHFVTEEPFTFRNGLAW